MVANSGDDDAGHVGERLRQRGFELAVFHRDGERDIDLDGVDLVVLLGSDWSVYWEKVATTSTASPTPSVALPTRTSPCSGSATAGS